MKQTITLFTLIALFCFMGTTVIAVNTSIIPTSSFPIDVIRSEDGSQVRKIYELPPGEEPPGILRDSFKQMKFEYSFLDLLREEIWITDKKEWKEEISIDSPKNDMDSVLALLEPTMDVETEDGFSGKLTLDITGIKTEVTGYGSKTNNISVTRTYPNLSSTDLQHIPKTTDDRGSTLAFQSIEWRTDNTMNVDDYEIGNRYTAVVTYGGTSTSSYVKGYKVTASYTGNLEKSYVEKVRYTAIFTGAEMKDPGIGVSPWFLAPVALLALGGIGWANFRKRKVTKNA